MAAFETAEATQAYRSRCEDRIGVVDFEDRVVITVADGAGGTSSGGTAADAVVNGVRAQATQCATENDWVRLLIQLDHQLGPGETTAVVVNVTADRITGASVGDTRAWIVDHGNVSDLSAHQVRKPLLGSGEAHVVGFSTDGLQGVLLIATDGLFNYTKPELIHRSIAQTDFYSLPRKLIDLVRLPSGEFCDDVGVVVCRRALVRRPRQKHVI
jgi:serine/threonine protein phosphatase PrpC